MLHASAFVRLLNCGFNWNARQPVLCHSSYGYDPQYICLARSSLSELILPRSSECQSSNGGSTARVEGIPSRPILISSPVSDFRDPCEPCENFGSFATHLFVFVFPVGPTIHTDKDKDESEGFATSSHERVCGSLWVACVCSTAARAAVSWIMQNSSIK